MPRTEQTSFEVRFLEKLQRLLAEGDFTSTYKFAVLLGLTGLSVEHCALAPTGGLLFTTEQLAERVIELYWPQVAPYAPRARGRVEVLFQNKPQQAAIVTNLSRLHRLSFGTTASPTHVHSLRKQRPGEFRRLLNSTEWKLIEMPLPRLQRIPSGTDDFIYTVHWTVDDVEPRGGRLKKVVRAYQQGLESDFDNRIVMKSGVVETLARLHGIVRDLVETRWVRMVRQLNPSVREEPDLHNHLFGSRRAALASIRGPLLALQDHHCFYCQRRLVKPEVDHFLPWSQSRDDRIENLVAACAQCNGAKREHLASEGHVDGWLQRLDPMESLLDSMHSMALEIGWPSGPHASLSLARLLYQHYPGGAQLWHARGDFRDWSRPRLLRHLESAARRLATIIP
jgi:5-methylcytosine-specific restriction endonuclease McrA